MKDRKEIIIAKAMELYATKGYSNVSITDLQLALDMGRGTLYYYFKNQDELFEECINRFFLEPKAKSFQLSEQDVTIEDMMDSMLKHIHSLSEVVSTWENKTINTNHMLHLMFTAYNLFPNLQRKALKLFKTENELWRKAILNGIRAGKIRRDIDVDTVAMLFSHVKDAYDIGQRDTDIDFSIFPKQYDCLYKLIKVEETK